MGDRRWAEKKTVNAIIGQFVVTEDATPEDLGTLLNTTPVHILVLFFAVAENVDSSGCSRRKKVKQMVSAAVEQCSKFEGQWLPGVAVLAAKERFKCPRIIEWPIVDLNGHCWCVDVTSIKNRFNPECSLRLAVVYNIPEMSAVADVSYAPEFMEQVCGAIARLKVQVLMGPLGKDPQQIGKLFGLYKPHYAALFFQAWRWQPREATRQPRPDLDAAVAERWGLDPQLDNVAFYPSYIMVFGPAKENRNRILKPFACSRQSVRKTCFTLISYEA